MSNKNIPVRFKGDIIGYTDSDMKVIDFVDKIPEELDNLLKGRGKCFISCRQSGEVDEFGKISDIKPFELDITKY